MISSFAYFAQPFSFDRLQQMVVVNGAIGRLLMACLLGGVIGLQREIHRKAAGVRTNLLICMGAAFFTLLSAVLAGDSNPDKGRVASNIVQGIGFLGAGLILHNRNRVSGLTSAASVWVVASIGMACGAGLYATAVLGTVIVIIALQLVGFLEQRANLKRYPLIYEVARPRPDIDADLGTRCDGQGRRTPLRRRARLHRRHPARELRAQRNQESTSAPAHSAQRRTGNRFAPYLPRSGRRLRCTI